MIPHPPPPPKTLLLEMGGEWTIFPDPDDRRLLRIKNPDRAEVTYFGSKDDSGSVISF
jgi:hypothetical protein